MYLAPQNIPSVTALTLGNRVVISPNENYKKRAFTSLNKAEETIGQAKGVNKAGQTPHV